MEDKIVLVTGSGRGIGASIALKFAENKCHLILNDIDQESAKKTAKEAESFGIKTYLSAHNISKISEVTKLFDEIKSEFGKIDVLINNAGITRDALLLKLTEEKWDEVINLNLKGVFAVGQAAAKMMAEQKSGVIVNLASIAWLGNVGQTNYSAAKAGVVAMTSTWALELARYNIRVNAIAPGFINTVLTQQVPQEIREKFTQKIPLKRFGSPRDIAELAFFLACPAGSYITGQCIQIDGGLAVGLGSL